MRTRAATTSNSFHLSGTVLADLEAAMIAGPHAKWCDSVLRAAEAVLINVQGAAAGR